jgi:hypothetical protein
MSKMVHLSIYTKTGIIPRQDWARSPDDPECAQA